MYLRMHLFIYYKLVSLKCNLSCRLFDYLRIALYQLYSSNQKKVFEILRKACRHSTISLIFLFYLAFFFLMLFLPSCLSPYPHLLYFALYFLPLSPSSISLLNLNYFPLPRKNSGGYSMHTFSLYVCLSCSLFSSFLQCLLHNRQAFYRVAPGRAK